MAISTEFVDAGKLIVWIGRSSCRRCILFVAECVGSVERSALAICILPAMVVTGRFAVDFAFGLARVTAAQPLAAAATSVGLVALNGRAAVIALLIAAFSTAVGENWRASAVKRSGKCVDVLAEVLFEDKAECRVWESAIVEVGVACPCTAVIIALFLSLPVRDF